MIIKKLKTDAQLEKYFYEHMNTKVDGEYLIPSMVYSPSYYMNSNADLKRQNWRSANLIYDHFVRHCIKKGKGEFRATSPWVSLKYLHDTYKDLRGMSAEALLKWSASYGLKLDQRQLSATTQARTFRKFYRVSEYAALNADLARAYSRPAMVSDFKKSRADLYWNHLWNNGIREGRRTSNAFNVKVYRKNARLSSKSSVWFVFDHYCNVGYVRGIKSK